MTVLKRTAAGTGPRNLLLGLAAVLLSGCAPDQVLRAADPALPADSLRQAFAPYFLLGTALSAQQIAGQERGTLPLVQQHFNSLTAENVMKWQLLQPVEGQFDFSAADALLALAEQQGSVLIGHTLLWHEQTPAWVFQGPDGGPASRELLLARLTSHIQTVLGRYRGKIKGWDVVNEALNEDGSLRDTPWRRILGDDFYLTAFALAQQADPAAELYYNDFNLFKPAKRQGAVRLVRQLQAAGIKVAGIGMQGHYGLDFPALQEVEDSIRAFAATGAQVMITELDITVLPNPEQAQIGADVSQKLALQARLNPYTAGLPAEVSQALTERYHALFRLFLQYEASISRVTLWGVHDGQSWRNGFPMQGRTDYALLFDRDLKPKPAVAALLQLAGEQRQSDSPAALRSNPGHPQAAIHATCEDIALNQLGFLPAAPKVALLRGQYAGQASAAGQASPQAGLDFQLLDSRGQPVWQGKTSAPKFWPLAGEPVRLADFSALTQPGDYRLVLGQPLPGKPVAGAAASDAAPADSCQAVIVKIAADPYGALHDAAIRAYYFNRASTALMPAFAGPYARPSGHPDDKVLVHASAASKDRPAGFVVSAAKGWYDAGDYNKYVVNSGVTTYTLLQAYSDFPAFYASRRWHIPESDNALPDLLDEVRWNLDWLRAMQDPGDGGVYHKLTNLDFDGTVMPAAATSTRYLVQKTTAAALNYAAVMAKASRVLAAFPDTQAQALDYAQSAAAAWRWAQAFPDVRYQQPVDVKTGAYGDNTLQDEFAFAAGALFLQSGDPVYLHAFTGHLAKAGALQAADWRNPLALVVAELALSPDTPKALQQQLQQRLQTTAEQYLAAQQSSAAGLAISASDLVWGSNSRLLNKAMLLLQAARFSAAPEPTPYRAAALGLLDYVLGRNPAGYSYVTGFGRKSPQHIHHRPSAADGIAAPVPGWLAGGANPGQQDQCQYPSAAAVKSYVDDYCSYASNEVAINWNAPLVYVLAALSQQGQ